MTEEQKEIILDYIELLKVFITDDYFVEMEEEFSKEVELAEATIKDLK